MDQIPNKCFMRYIFLFSLFGVCCQVKSQPFKTVKEFKNYLLDNIEKVDFIEGIWEFNVNIKSGVEDTKDRSFINKYPPFNIDVFPYRVAIIKVPDNYFYCYKISDFSGEIGEIIDPCSKYLFKSTALEGQYIYDINTPCQHSYHGKAIIKSNGDLYFEGKYGESKNDMILWDNFTVTATKLSPTPIEIKTYKAQAGEGIRNISPKYSYGTGSAINNDLIITCYHVVKNAKQISIRGIDGRFDTTYLASINSYDEDLDIAFLKIQKNVIHHYFELPYSFKQTKSEVGENIFVLGYPLQNTMGQEIKLTTGVISSNSGFLGDTTLFQISAPIQPGNSGGPLFDYNGSLIGLVIAKHINADNVGYAFKISLIKEILKRKGVRFSSFQATNIDLSEKVKLYKNYIYSIEVSLD